jgi:hypothetical protein
MRMEGPGWRRASRLKKGIVVSAWTLGFVSLIYSGYLYLDYGARMPRSPDPAAERVKAFDYKGRTVYVTEAEASRYRTVHLMFEVSLALFAAGVVIWGRPWVVRAA